MFTVGRRSKGFLSGIMILGALLSSCTSESTNSPNSSGVPGEARPEPSLPRDQQCATLEIDRVAYFVQDELSVQDREQLRKECQELTEECIQKIDEVLLGYDYVLRPEAYLRLISELGSL